MNCLGPLARAVALAGVLAAMGTAPTLAAPDDVALLRSYIGDWRGSGTLTGSKTDTVVCRLSLKPGNSGKVNYSGRCTLAGANLAINGTLAFIEASQRYEAAMTSNANFSGLAVGQKRGHGLVFQLRERERDEKGKPLAITADITLTAERIDVGFVVVDMQTGQSLRAQVPFAK